MVGGKQVGGERMVGHDEQVGDAIEREGGEWVGGE